MAATGKHLTIKAMGENVLGVQLSGNPKTPEPIHFRVMFPGGDVDVVRTTDDEYWVHIRIDHPDDGGGPERAFVGKIEAARLDSMTKHSKDMDLGDFNDPDLYHLAVKVVRREA